MLESDEIHVKNLYHELCSFLGVEGLASSFSNEELSSPSIGNSDALVLFECRLVLLQNG